MAVGDINSDKRGSGARYNDGKVPYELVPTHLLENTARVFGYGAKKYDSWNWAKGMAFSVVIGCIKRHIAAIERGEDIDPESGLPHTGHIGCNLLMLEHYMSEYPEMDDRPKKWFGARQEPEGKNVFPEKTFIEMCIESKENSKTLHDRAEALRDAPNRWQFHCKLGNDLPDNHPMKHVMLEMLLDSDG